MKDYWKGAIAGAICTAVVFTAGIAAVKFEKRGTLMADSRVVDKLVYLENMIDRYYLEDSDETALEESLYKGLVDGLEDPYSYYYTVEEYEQENEESEGTYRGIGVLMELDESLGKVMIQEVYKDSPAERAGLQAGDVILEINGTNIKGRELSEVVELIMSDEEHAELRVEREGETLDIATQVEEVDITTVKYEMLDDKIGYLRIEEFDGVTYDQFAEAYDELNTAGMERLIIDLRNNPGGYVHTVCDILREILPEGLIVYTEDKYGNRSEQTCDGENEIRIPLVVLVNEGSASASEIFAGAVKDHEIGTILGTTTFGKGIVQSVYSLNDGSGLQLTVSKYYTPNGINIHEKGIEPDIYVEDDTETDLDEQLQKAIELIEG